MLRQLFLIAASTMLLSYHQIADYIPFTVQGTVKDNRTGAPLKYAHVYTIKGEEEAVTDDKGGFEFQSWKESATLTIEREGYQKKEIRLTLPAPKQNVLLSKE